MDMKATIEKIATSQNAGGVFYLSFPYTSSVGKETEELSVQVPMKLEHPSEADKKALFEAVSVQGGIGKWTEKADGSVWLIPADGQ